jgi:hypothetical protein
MSSTGGSFLTGHPGFEHWASTADQWRNRQGSTWWMDINSRAVEQDAAGQVRIHPDATGSTAWFGDVLNHTTNNSSDDGQSRWRA